MAQRKNVRSMLPQHSQRAQDGETTLHWRPCDASASSSRRHESARLLSPYAHKAQPREKQSYHSSYYFRCHLVGFSISPSRADAHLKELYFLWKANRKSHKLSPLGVHPYTPIPINILYRFQRLFIVWKFILPKLENTGCHGSCIRGTLRAI